MKKIVDSHIHFWQLSRGDYFALEPHMTILLKDHLPNDLEPLLKAAGVDQIVVVEAAETIEETLFVFELAEKHRFIAGVVGWIDLSSPNVRETLGFLAKNPIYKGVRPLRNDNKTIRWLSDEANSAGLRALADQGLSFDALVQDFNELRYVISLAEKFPDLPVILNHCGKPDIRKNLYSNWAADIARLAQMPNVVCKFSGLLNQAGSAWTLKGIRPYAEHVMSCFGPARLLWGSDWPPARLTEEYDVWWTVAHELLTHLPAAEQEMIFGGNATRIYRLQE